MKVCFLLFLILLGVGAVIQHSVIPPRTGFLLLLKFCLPGHFTIYQDCREVLAPPGVRMNFLPPRHLERGPYLPSHKLSRVAIPFLVTFTLCLEQPRVRRLRSVSTDLQGICGINKGSTSFGVIRTHVGHKGDFFFQRRDTWILLIQSGSGSCFLVSFFLFDSYHSKLKQVFTDRIKMVD